MYSGVYYSGPADDYAPIQFFKGIKGKPLQFENPIPIKTLSGALPILVSLTEAGPFKDYDTHPTRTKPNLVDFNGDGNLDLVYGESIGVLVSFKGTASKGIGHFSNQGEILKDENGEYLKVRFHSSPHFVDWDGDRDLDIICGSGKGGIFYSENIGNAKAPKWKSFTAWVPELAAEDVGRGRHITQNGRQKLQPCGDKTIYVTDFNNDGKLDLLVGDRTIIDTPLEDVTDEEYTQKEAQYRAMVDDDSSTAKLSSDYQKLRGKGARQELIQISTQMRIARNAKREKDKAFMDSFKTSESTGFVWLYLQR